jgi:sirohydrochlorin cobaltochelatase
MSALAQGAQRAIVLFAHGSRDPLWHRPIQAVADAIALRAPATPVACAYLELSTPDLHTTCAALIGQGAKALTIVPMFLGVGKHAREDLPALMAQMRQHWPEVDFQLQAAVGENPRLIELLADIALG